MSRSSSPEQLQKLLGVPLDIPERPTSMVEIREVVGHPLGPDDPRGKAYLVMIDSTEEGMERMQSQASSLEVHSANANELRTMGE